MWCHSARSHGEPAPRRRPATTGGEPDGSWGAPPNSSGYAGGAGRFRPVATMTNPQPTNDGEAGASTWLVIAVVGAAIVLLSVPAWAFVQNVVLSDSTDSTLLETAATTTSSTGATVPTPTTVGQVTTTTTAFEDTPTISAGTTPTSGATTNTTGDGGTTTTSPKSTTTAPPGTTTPPTTTPPTTTPPSTTTTAPPSTTTTPTAEAPIFTGSIVNFDYSPITIKVGDRVRWTNKDSVSHTATSSSGLWNSGTIKPGETSLPTKVFLSTGTFNYFCKFHGEMSGTVVVSG